jgi:hypothetical protein
MLRNEIPAELRIQLVRERQASGGFNRTTRTGGAGSDDLRRLRTMQLMVQLKPKGHKEQVTGDGDSWLRLAGIVAQC